MGAGRCAQRLSDRPLDPGPKISLIQGRAQRSSSGLNASSLAINSSRILYMSRVPSQHPPERQWRRCRRRLSPPRSSPAGAFIEIRAVDAPRQAVGDGIEEAAGPAALVNRRHRCRCGCTPHERRRRSAPHPVVRSNAAVSTNAKTSALAAPPTDATLPTPVLCCACYTTLCNASVGVQ